MAEAVHGGNGDGETGGAGRGRLEGRRHNEVSHFTAHVPTDEWLTSFHGLFAYFFK